MNDKFLVVWVDQNAESESLSEEANELETVGGSIKAVNCFCEEDVIRAAADADVITTDATPLSRHIFESLPRLKAVMRRGVGYDIIDVKAATENGVVVINIPAYCAEEVSNHVLMFLLMIAKKSMKLCTLTKAGRWSDALNEVKPMGGIHGETLGIVGCGRLGQMVAKKAKTLGMRVIGYDAYLPKDVFESAGIEQVSFEELLRQSDYVTLHVALTDETRHMINEEALRKMKPTAALINTARGAVVDEKALLKALQNGWIAAAGLDVFEKEPATAENPLLTLDNVLAMPHTANYSDAAIAKLHLTAGQEEVRIAKGMMPASAVNGKVVNPKIPLLPYQD